MPEVTVSGERLDQWKAIASYLGKDVSTVIRWAKENGLPVHRVPGKQKRRPVFAYRCEIDAWMASSVDRGDKAVGGDLQQQVERTPASKDSPETSLDRASPPSAPQEFLVSRRQVAHKLMVVWVLAGAVIAVMGVLGLLRRFFYQQFHSGGESLLMSEGFPVDGPLVAAGGNLYFAAWRGGRIVPFTISESGGTAREIPVPFVQSQPLDVSIDGRRLLLLVGMGQEKERKLWWFPLNGGEPTRVGEIACHTAALSPSGRSLAYAYGNSIYVTQDNGLSSRLLHNFTGLPTTLRWSKDGTRILSLVRDDAEFSVVWRLLIDTHEALTLTSLAPLTRVSHRFSSLSPVLDDNDDVFLGGDDSDPSIYLLKNPTITAFSATQLQRFAATRSGVSDIALDRRSHALYYGRPTARRDELDIYHPRSGNIQPFMPGISAHDVDFSRDGRAIVYVTDPASPTNTLWVARSDGNNPRQLDTRGLDTVGLPRWSPDGKQLAFMGRRSGEPYRIYVMPALGREPVEVSHTNDNQGAPTWSPDGRSILYGRVLCQEANACGIFRIDLETGSVTMIAGSEGLSTARWSPDGRYIAALRTESHQLLLKDQRTGQWKILADGVNGNDLAWSPDSLAIYASRPDGVRPAVLRVSVSGEVQEALDLSPWTRLTGRVDTWFAVAPDGSLIFVRLVTGSEIIALDYIAP
ncbi:hypothetical protein [Occallatibacter riparius]|uniref:Uncharacterized protein n=1 Tax=Occallatibacter riparius TaxID=1002689 RepID=A0A9J7BQZ7_9BACT|nr:hypothetical protein [Occallatibacter riparius]UWZ85251.1 hypothetical protein MOP44_04745 [Occallatibacter riparius]